MGSDGTPADLREGVRTGIVSALGRDVELRGGRTARLLLVAGALGSFGALGMILMLSGHPYGHHPTWHVVAFTAIWSGLLVVALSIALLRVRTPALPLARAACVAIVGLGLAGVCMAICPDQHCLVWWSKTELGSSTATLGGLPLSALCFGVMTTLLFGAAAAAAALGDRSHRPIGALLPAAMLVLLLSPGVALQSIGTSWLVFVAWLAGTAAGAYAGVALGIAARSRFTPSLSAGT